MYDKAVFAWYQSLQEGRCFDTYNEWLQFVATSVIPPGIRLGQYWFIELRAARPEIAHRISARLGGVDPYDNDTNMNRFLMFVKACWDEKV